MSKSLSRVKFGRELHRTTRGAHEDQMLHQAAFRSAIRDSRLLFKLLPCSITVILAHCCDIYPIKQSAKSCGKTSRLFSFASFFLFEDGTDLFSLKLKLSKKCKRCDADNHRYNPNGPLLSLAGLPDRA
ncbi:hypothetical protein RRG08_045640 [Elysia crispata]|uniref:Uncharacterized protein n=1 Tax=Elysia crispata TaxID=231223 RepID=A0AAE1CQ40_9GAST|nr:hypothetical protein RRG08_045640 [Elysia crispata]